MSTEFENAKKHLSQDPVMKSLVDTLEINPLQKSNQLFHDLLESVTSQQLSVKAADTIFQRFKTLLPEALTPQGVYALTHEQLRAAGLSNAKATYIHAIAHEIVINKLDPQTLYSMSDQEVISQLTKIKGIGQWTAEMVLIFSLARPDIFSVGDLGLRAAIEKHYGIERTKLKEIETLSQQWQPYRSYACRYLWKSLSVK